MKQALILLGLMLPLACKADAGNWPNWRGPSGDGICLEKNIPVTWNTSEGVAWKIALPGPAGATPIVWDKQIFLTSVNDQDELLLLSYSTDGSKLWEKVIAKGNQKARGDEGNSASPSPCTDGKHVWTFMGEGTLTCTDFAGNVIWSKNLQDEYGKFDIQFGMSSTPVLRNGVLYLQLIHGDGNPETREARVIALDGATGKEVWKSERPSDARQENEHSYASPVVYDDGKTAFLVTHGADYVVAFDFATGKELWRCGGLNPKNDPRVRYDPTLRFVASPVAAPGLIIVPSAKKGPVVALKPNGSGDITGQTSLHAWRLDRTPDVPSPLVYDGIAYLCMENGDLNAVRAATGEKLYYERTHRDRHRASPVYADGHVYLSSRDGQVTVIQAGETFKIVAENKMGENLSASPAISNGTLYLRTFQHLWAIRSR